MQKDLQAKQRQAAAASTAGGGGASKGGAAGAAVNGSKSRVDYWLYEGIVVKVLSKALKEQGYYKQKVSGLMLPGQCAKDWRLCEAVSFWLPGRTSLVETTG